MADDEQQDLVEKKGRRKSKVIANLAIDEDEMEMQVAPLDEEDGGDSARSYASARRDTVNRKKDKLQRLRSESEARSQGSMEQLAQIAQESTMTLGGGVSVPAFAPPATRKFADSEVPLIEMIKSLTPEELRLGDRVMAALQFGSLLDLLPYKREGNQAIGSDGSRRPMTHRELYDFVYYNFGLRSQFGLGANDRVGSLVPTGPESATTFLTCAAWVTYAPLNPASQEEEIRTELANVSAKAIIVQKGEENSAAFKVADELGIIVIEITPDPIISGKFSTECVFGRPGKPSEDPPHGPNDTSLVLHTSGTTGKKKVVPYRLKSLVTGSAVMAAAYKFGPNDVNLNMMPLFHVGGLARNVLAPMLTGGSCFCQPAFNAKQFWELIPTCNPTWYYGSPTMHQLILEAGQACNPLPKHRIRIIANAAGPLPHTVALAMKDLFKTATILPSYGMTECMPISAPPLDYDLEHPGTSGLACGPLLGIMDGSDQLVPHETTGEVVVKGPPTFEGYEGNPAANDSSFADGWFKTGDTGHLDAEGWLFITGRSKEVINRGGEIISPTEVESELLKHGRIRNCIAFSTPHDTLQECVGIVIVTPKGQTPVGLTEVQRFVAKRLFPAKWPQVVVFMDDVPKGATGKPMRVQLSKRLNMPSINDNTPKMHKVFNADCPAQGTKVSEPISMTPRTYDAELLKQLVLTHEGVEDAHVCMVDLLGGQESKGKQLCTFVVPASVKVGALWKTLMSTITGTVEEDLVPNIIVPLDAFPLKADGSFDEHQLIRSRTEVEHRSSWRLSSGFRQYAAPTTPLEVRVQRQFQKVLGGVDPDKKDDEKHMISVDADFFAIGGTSIMAGQLAGLLRKTFGVGISGTALFRYRTIKEVVGMIEASPDYDADEVRPISVQLRRKSVQSGRAGDSDKRSSSEAKSYARSSNRLIVWLVQLLPLISFHPIQRIFTWAIFIAIWAELQENNGMTRFVSLIVALVLARIARMIIFPILGIACKWIVIGKYKHGTWPVWSSYYLRWWFVNQTLQFTGLGMFENSNNLTIMYYRLLGATIGGNVKLSSDARITEPDLVFIGDGAMVDAESFLCPFTLDTYGVFMMAPVRVGFRSVVCHRGIVCPGTEVPDGRGLGPLTCTYELPESDGTDWAKYCRVGFDKGPLIYRLLIGYPILLLVYLVSYIPVVVVIYYLVRKLKDDERTDDWRGILDWFLITERLLLYLMVRAVRKCITPFIRLFLIILIKWTVIGRFKEGDYAKMGGYAKFKRWLMHALLPDGKMAGVHELVGHHYEYVSMVFRLLGAKIGKRVYWPGSGVPVIEFDLFECEDDVVWGSRSIVMNSHRDAAKRITLKHGANVSDRCFIMPGVTVGEAVVMGSSTIGSEDFDFPKGSKWLGSQNGQPTMLEQSNVVDLDLRSPFSRAVYDRKAKGFYAFHWWLHPFINIPVFSLVAVYRSLRLVMAWLLTDLVVGGKDERNQLYYFEYIGILLGVYMAINLVFFMLSITLDIIFKWLIIGSRRKQGLFPWDESDYCQRWKLYLLFQHWRNTFPVLHFMEGTEMLCMYFRAMGARIGKDVCLYPTGGDPMMTEPEMVTIKDRANIEDAILVAHINTKGVFGLDWVKVEEDACMRRFSRLMAGGTLEPNAILMEHTLVLPGSVVDAGTVWQGWPSQMISKRELDDFKPMRSPLTRPSWNEQKVKAAIMSQPAKSLTTKPCV